ncbi:MAG: T9SS type A sorting domain-containing protein [Ignavibacteriae bacterium]|nr:T9SS type A sorting domain-containing protein [Ignavibacteriota bacterium]
MGWQSALVPSDIFLKQNYPNPFNPSTKISFTLPSQSFVSLKVYDLLGREIAILLNSKMETGEHIVNWDASNRESGVYVYRIVTENYVETRKMLLAK